MGWNWCAGIEQLLHSLTLVAIVKIWLIIFGLLGLCSCGGDPSAADYEYPLSGDFSVRRTSNHQIAIASRSALQGVPAKIVELGWDKRFIVVKQQLLKNRGDFPGDNFLIPDPGKYQFWIIDVVNTNRIGPLNESAFLERTGALGVSTIKMKPASAYLK